MYCFSYTDVNNIVDSNVIKIYNNVITESGKGIISDGSGTFDIQNNIVVGNSVGMMITSADANIDYNDLWNNM